MKLLLTLVMFVGLLFGSIDINKANIKELTALKGIGKSKAEAIVKHRKSKCFKKVDDLLLVKGIGKKTIEKNRKNLSASKCKK